MKNNDTVTYSFAEALDRIANAETQREVVMYRDLIFEERYGYALFYLQVLLKATFIKQEYLPPDPV